MYRTTLDVPTRYQWDTDSRLPAPDPGTAPGNCGITCVTVAEMYYNDQFHGIYTNRRLVTASLELSSTIGEQAQILWKRNVPNAIDKINLAGLHELMKSKRRPIVLGLDFSKVPLSVAGHPFRGSHSIMLRANATGGFTYLDPNFNRTYRTDPEHGYRFMPDWVLNAAYYNVPTQWAIIPTKDKLVPSLPDTATSPSIPRVKGLPKLFKNLSGKELHVRAFKPLRDGASTNAERLETTDANGWTLRAWGQTNGETLGGSDNWYFGPKFIDGKWRVVYSPKIDIR
jgi:hypothetical protein